MCVFRCFMSSRASTLPQDEMCESKRKWRDILRYKDLWYVLPGEWQKLSLQTSLFTSRRPHLFIRSLLLRFLAPSHSVSCLHFSPLSAASAQYPVFALISCSSFSPPSCHFCPFQTPTTHPLPPLPLYSSSNLLPCHASLSSCHSCHPLPHHVEPVCLSLTLYSSMLGISSSMSSPQRVVITARLEAAETADSQAGDREEKKGWWRWWWSGRVVQWEGEVGFKLVATFSSAKIWGWSRNGAGRLYLVCAPSDHYQSTPSICLPLPWKLKDGTGERGGNAGWMCRWKELWRRCERKMSLCPRFGEVLLDTICWHGATSTAVPACRLNLFQYEGAAGGGGKGSDEGKQEILVF